jgi:hypothetical protein
MSISVETFITNQVSLIEVRYLVVESSLSYIEVAHFEALFPAAVAYSSTSSPVFTVNTSVSVNQATDNEYQVINGYDIHDDPMFGDRKISLEVQC